MCKKKIYRLCNVKQLEQNIKSRCNSHFLWNAWKLMFSLVRVTSTCDQCDSVFCTLQVAAFDETQLMYSIILLCLFVSKYDINAQSGWITALYPATNLNILICKSSARIQQSVIMCCFSFTFASTRWLHWFHTKLPPIFYNRIAPMPRVNEFFARVNERRGLNEIYAPNFLYPLVPCICLVFFSQNI